MYACHASASAYQILNQKLIRDSWYWPRHHPLPPITKGGQICGKEKAKKRKKEKKP